MSFPVPDLRFSTPLLSFEVANLLLLFGQVNLSPTLKGEMAQRLGICHMYFT